MHMIKNHDDYFYFVEKEQEADFIVKSKFRGINPWVILEPV